MRLYKVYYAIKRDGHCYLHNMTVRANNRQQAYAQVKVIVKEKQNRNAFYTTVKEPIKTKYGLEFNGMIYTRYNELLNRLW